MRIHSGWSPHRRLPPERGGKEACQLYRLDGMYVPACNDRRFPAVRTLRADDHPADERRSGGRSAHFGERPLCRLLRRGGYRAACLLAGAAKRPRSREAILDAAEAVAAEHGAAQSDAGRRGRAALGVSKGGLLYNFSTKEALLEAMLDRHMHRFEAIQQQAFDSLPSGPGRALKALVLSARGPCPEREKHSGLRHAGRHRPQSPTARTHPGLAPPTPGAVVRRRVAGGLPFARAAAIFAGGGRLCLLEILQVSPYQPADRQQIIDDLLRLVDETALAAVDTVANPLS